jgi:hypothetical protein
MLIFIVLCFSLSEYDITPAASAQGFSVSQPLSSLNTLPFVPLSGGTRSYKI